LAAHGFTLDPATGEVTQLTKFVGPFSARAAQIARNLDRYEAEWRAAQPGIEPGPRLRRAWDARAWADARPDKAAPRDGAELTRRWVAELHELGYRPPVRAASIDAVRVGAIDRRQVVNEVLTRLGARRSGWNAADIRGEVEQLIARRNVVTAATVRCELAEDLTARALAECVPLLHRTGVPEHVRALTSQPVLDVEANLVARLATRAATPAATNETLAGTAAAGLDVAQRAVLAALAGHHQLLVIEGAAGAGKTTTLTAARAALAQAGHRLVVVTPTLKAARVASGQLGSPASSAARLAYQHGYRRDTAGAWTRLTLGEADPVTGLAFAGPDERAQLRWGDLMLVDEAGMLDQDTARAVLRIADECGARLALMGDRHQLPAVGRGGVLDLAARWAAPEAHLTLDTVHRFTHTTTGADGAVATVEDQHYARLSLAMRNGTEPGEVFDALDARGQIRLHATESDRTSALAEAAAQALTGGQRTAVIADTRAQVAALNATIRERRTAAGQVDDTTTATTDAGQRIGAGDLIATRRNDPTLSVANRDTWLVTHVQPDGSLRVTPRGQAGVTRRNTVGDETHHLPADYVRRHVELAYASTVYAVQGDTTQTAHTAIGEHTSAASAYVAMTRGRDTNIAHLVADNLDEAHEQWIAVFGRHRADLGPAHAAELAAREAVRYARLRPLDDVLDDLGRAWTLEAGAETRLEDARRRVEILRDIVAVTEQRDAVLPDLQRTYHQARADAEIATTRLRRLEHAVTASSEDTAAALKDAWAAQRPAAHEAAQTVRAGTGRLGQRRAAVRDAHEHLADWSSAWRPHLPAMPSDPAEVVAFAAWFDDTPRHYAHFDSHARTLAEEARPDYLAGRTAAHDADLAARSAFAELHQAERRYSMALDHHGSLGHAENPAKLLTQSEQAVAGDEALLRTAREQINALRAEPTLRTQPAQTIELARADWTADRDATAAWRALLAAGREDRIREQRRDLDWGSRGWGGVSENFDHDRHPGISR
jgi:thymidine kinase